jgi:hypothetical protein
MRRYKSALPCNTPLTWLGLNDGQGAAEINAALIEFNNQGD